MNPKEIRRGAAPVRDRYVLAGTAHRRWNREELAKDAEAWIAWLAQYGGEEGGGVTRLLYDKAWQSARAALADRMGEMGFSVRADRTGNTFGRLEGTSGNPGAIGVGSHFDTVRSGGRYDGAYGIVAGLMAADLLRRLYGPPVRSIEVAAFCEEEGSRFPLAYWGSGSLTGARTHADIAALKDPEGIRFPEAMAAAGFGREDQPEPCGTDWTHYLEVHIEQGPVLEAEGLSIGIAEVIVGQKRFAFTVRGSANHAGTTPMGQRSDALAGAAAMAVALEDMALLNGEPLVATVGRMEVYPNTPNVVPGEVRFTADVRHSDGEALEAFCDRMEERFRRIAEARGLSLESSLWVNTAPVPLDAVLAAKVERSALACGMKYRRMPSGAGHDAQMIQAVCPSALVFVPSRGGISHSPEEYTAPEHLAEGVLVLTDLLYKLAYEVRTT
ncbi:Zn-dependent hydrolase [Gorillibacterium sp. sgz5001074]|uniref:Zn-dependent hydrolase n=1 Tax=Gorillibacterium sp. sgz5001074 TaxID=3446695 RepID=UPI003F66A6FB